MNHLPRLGLLLAVAAALPIANAAAQQGAIDIFTERSNDMTSSPTSPFFSGVELDLFGFDSVSSVTVDIDHGGGSTDNLNLIDDGQGSWFIDQTHTDVASIAAALHGDWTVTITATIGGNPANSVSTFTVDTSTLQDSDYLPTPTITNPVHGAAGLAPDTVFSWIAPNPIPAGTILAVDVEDGNFDVQEAFSLPGGGINLTDQAWDPPNDLAPGHSTFFVNYLKFFDESNITSIQTQGNITWINPLHDIGLTSLWPDDKPLFTLDSLTGISFLVIPEPATIALLSLGCLMLTRRRAA